MLESETDPWKVPIYTKTDVVRAWSWFVAAGVLFAVVAVVIERIA